MTMPPNRLPPQKPQYFSSGRLIMWSVLLFALVGALGYAAYYGGPSAYGGFDVTMKVMADPLVVPLTGDGAGKIKMTIKVQNRTAAAKNLNAPAPCKLFRWVLTGPEGELVQARSDACDDLLMEMTLQPSESKTEEIEVLLDTARLKPGSRYQFTLEYWGLAGMLIVHTE